MEKRLLIALGGGTILGRTERGSSAEQRENLGRTCARIAQLAAAGWSLVLTYGNGPQVGNIVLQNQHARSLVPPMPLDVCGAQSQGQIGYLLQNALEAALHRHGLNTPVATVVTRVIVDTSDPSFMAPEKAVGPTYTAAKAADLMRLGVTMREGERGWRQVVPSPVPLEVVETPMIGQLLEAGYIVIAGGGGGVPVVRGRADHLCGVEAVVEKDLTSGLLAVELRADLLVYVTDVPRVALDFGGEDPRELTELTPEDAHRLCATQLPKESMGVKVQAAACFVDRTGKPAIITDGQGLSEAVTQGGGTRILPK